MSIKSRNKKKKKKKVEAKERRKKNPREYNRRLTQIQASAIRARFAYSRIYMHVHRKCSMREKKGEID